MSQTRSFKSYANVAPATPFAIACKLCSIDGYAQGAGWLQLHDSAAAPAGGAVPLKSWNVAGAGPLPSSFWTLGPVNLLNGLTFAFSSTEGTYTALATSFDIWGEVDEYEQDCTQGATVVGDLTTLLGSSGLSVWADTASPTKRLVQVSAAESLGSDCYLVAVAKAATGIGVRLIGKVLANTTKTFKFGVQGITPLGADTDFTVRNGCILYMVDIPASGPIVFPPVISANRGCIKAWYVS